ncbi:hypothetical protein JQC91_12690 [Jannaschia sp. Os4]|uniref:hypothetical protein n=1 Tax=Jannaschia sp. Os4 TaxID=2807617 RepID=UPI001939349D|nr:hypothetical protein [Jannaschia sp. Os4]MBM2577158.1 hypothetical protein [Jannaschia sp. Os4]
MTRLRLLLAILAASSAPLSAQEVATSGLARIAPDEQGVHLRGDAVVGVMEAGLNPFVPLLERVVIYPVHAERTLLLDARVAVGGCPVGLEAAWSVDDVLAFHALGGEAAAVAAMRAAADGALADLSFEPGVARGVVAGEARARLSPAWPDGVRLAGVTLRPGGCGSVLDRYRLREEADPAALPDLPGAGAHRAPLGDLRLVAGDGSQAVLRGAVAGFDVTDAAALRACAGDGGVALIGPRVASAVAGDLRVAVGAAPREDLPAALAPALPGPATGWLAECGVAVRGVTYGDARLSRLVEVDCFETPGAAVCARD